MAQTAFDADAATILFHEQMNLDLVGEKKPGYKNRMVTVKQWVRKGDGMTALQLGVLEFAEKSKTMYSIEGSDIVGFECVEDDEHFELKIFPEDGISLVKVQFNNEDQKFRFFRSLEQTFPNKLSRNKVKDAPRKAAEFLIQKKSKSALFTKESKSTLAVRTTAVSSPVQRQTPPPESKPLGVDEGVRESSSKGQKGRTNNEERGKDASSHKGKGGGSGQGHRHRGGKGRGGKGRGSKGAPSSGIEDAPD
eukprot:GEMP01062237.1.p1 GENE.GEMP01062237.1~~GEMP01062237.1.p1  ORF type:complete len:250 (+),score=51.87 GEMP01062237.1:600-1349(+)